LVVQKNDAIIIPSDFSHENVPEGSGGLHAFLSIAFKMENLWSKKMMPFFILSGLSYQNRDSRVWKDWCDLVETRSPHFKMDSRMSLNWPLPDKLHSIIVFIWICKLVMWLL
jgi:hypothetical protein